MTTSLLFKFEVRTNIIIIYYQQNKTNSMGEKCPASRLWACWVITKPRLVVRSGDRQFAQSAKAFADRRRYSYSIFEIITSVKNTFFYINLNTWRFPRVFDSLFFFSSVVSVCENCCWAFLLFFFNFKVQF